MVCGDAVCDRGENPQICPVDCGETCVADNERCKGNARQECEENGRWVKLFEHVAHDSSVNSVNWAPHELGLVLACGSSDGSISILSYDDAGQSWNSEKVANAHTIGCNAVSWAPYMYQRQAEDGTDHEDRDMQLKPEPS